MRAWLAVPAAAALALAVAAGAPAAGADTGAAPGAARGVGKADRPAGPARAEGVAGKTAVRKAKARFVTGTIAAIDPAAGTLTVRGRKGPVPLAAGDRVAIDGYRVGDRVTVKHSGGVALSIKRPRAKRVAAAGAEGVGEGAAGAGSGAKAASAVPASPPPASPAPPPAPAGAR